MTSLSKIAFLASAFAFVLPQWSAADEAVRFPPLKPEQLTPPQKQFADDMAKPPRGGNINNAPFKVYIRSPDFGLHAIAMSDYLRWGTALSPELTELTILIAARQWSSGYIWHAHYALAEKAGMDPKIPAAIAAGTRPETMNADEKLIYDFVTQIYRDHDISDATYNAALAKYGEKGVVDIIGLASYYGITAMSLIAARATYPAGAEPRLEKLAQIFPN
jgi:4-carboxymuconolactone decarboxylase